MKEISNISTDVANECDTKSKHTDKLRILFKALLERKFQEPVTKDLLKDSINEKKHTQYVNLSMTDRYIGQYQRKRSFVSYVLLKLKNIN